jgi:hypothetical protein
LNKGRWSRNATTRGVSSTRNAGSAPATIAQMVHLAGTAASLRAADVPAR